MSGLSVELPNDERMRAEALSRYAILDTPPEPAFDGMARLAARLCHVPFAVVTLLDHHRQWFKARVGLPVRETPRAIAFCNHTVAAGALLEIEDARRDTRFAENPLVVGPPHLRFYAGAPLFAPGGVCIGTLAVMDEVPRRLREDERLSLRRLADVVVEELEARAVELGRPGREAAPAFRHADSRLPVLVSQVPAVVWTTDLHARFTSSIGSGLAKLGLLEHQVVGMTVEDFLGSSVDAAKLMEAHAHAFAGEGSQFPFTFAGNHYQLRLEPLLGPASETVGAIGVAIDVTERKAVEARLHKADRLAAVGTVAASVAHEINNPLAYVATNLEFLDEWLGKEAARPHGERLLPDESAQGQAALSEARAGLARVRQIMGDLKLFTRIDEERGPVDLCRVLERSVGMTGNEIRARARLVVDLRPLPTVHATEARLGQVFVNLLLNAAQAIPAGNPADNVVRVHTDVDADGRAVVVVEDSGVGIAPDLRDRIFEPFFTTKAVGEGSGLGLFVCERIVHAMDGELRVESRPGGGARFVVALPTVCIVEKKDPAPPPSVRRPRLLIIDDEPRLARAVTRALGPEYEVVTAENGRGALDMLESGQEFDLMLCDLMMPVMTGMELHGVLVNKRPALADRLVFMTGGAFTEDAHEFLDRVRNPRLEKPFSSDALRGLLRRS